jgi:hypothetical protein
VGSQLKVTNASMHNYQGAIYAASWTVILRGGCVCFHPFLL